MERLSGFIVVQVNRTEMFHGPFKEASEAAEWMAKARMSLSGDLVIRELYIPRIAD